MTWAVVAATAGQIGGALLGGMSARKQAEAKRKALEAARGDITRAYETSTGYYKPYAAAGEEGLNALRGLMNYKQFGAEDFKTDPGYQFRLQEGLKKLGRTSAARGGVLSGATLRGTQGYAQNLASEEYSNAFSRYLQQRQEDLRIPTYLTGMGQQVAGNLAYLSTNYGANMANFSMGAGAIDAAQTAAKYGVYSDILGAGTNFLGAVKGAGGFGKFFGGGTGGGQYGLGSTQAQLGYQNAMYNPKSGTFDVNF